MHFSLADVTVSPIVVILWSAFVGYIFSTIGAAGGILAGVGHITVFGMKKANMIKPMNQMLTVVTPLISTPLYLREKRIVVPAAIALGVGGIAGALFGSWASHTFLPDLKDYKPFFGALTLVIAARLWYEFTAKFQEGQKKVKEANKVFESKVKEAKASGNLDQLKAVGVKFEEMGINNTFTFAGQIFKYNTLSPFIIGFLVAIVSSSMGVGGGFLLVPYLSSMLGFPMFIVAGTSVLSILVTSAASISNYLAMGSKLDWTMLSFEVVGIVIGTVLGAQLSKYIKAKYLKAVLAVVLTYIGIGYVFGPAIKAITGLTII